jgi:hypothetical protein
VDDEVPDGGLSEPMAPPMMLARNATFGLLATKPTLAYEAFDAKAWAFLRAAVRHHRLAGVLQARVEAGSLPVTAERRADVEKLRLAACAVVLLLERRLLEVVEFSVSAGIDLVVLKGSAVAHLPYPDPGHRMLGDNKLLLRSEQFDAAVDVLCCNGCLRQTTRARPGFERRLARRTTLDSDEGDELDLFRSAATFEVGGRQLRGLGPETRLLHACYHAGLGDPNTRLRSVRDNAQMLASGVHDPVWGLAIARPRTPQAVLARGMRRCAEVLGFDADDELTRSVSGHVPSTHELRAIGSHVGENRRFAARVVALLSYLDGLGAKAAIVGSVVFPEEGFAESFGGRSGIAWISRGVRSFLRGGRR